MEHLQFKALARDELAGQQPGIQQLLPEPLDRTAVGVDQPGRKVAHVNRRQAGAVYRIQRRIDKGPARREVRQIRCVGNKYLIGA